MPDHVHFFCAPAVAGIGDPGHNPPVDSARREIKDLPGFIQQWKQWTSKRIMREYQSNKFIQSASNLIDAIKIATPIWQEGFFDHLLRSEESYNEKWEYVRLNPVRKGLVDSSDDWPWQGDIYQLW